MRLVEILSPGKRRQVSRTFRGNLRDAKKAQTYRHDIAPTLGAVSVKKVNTKMLTDLYGEHQKRGLAPRSVYQIHATISSMMTQACRWGWRNSNPAQWAEPPAQPNKAPVVPTPEKWSN